jgi:predicted outer membrane repeat protein
LCGDSTSHSSAGGGGMAVSQKSFIIANTAFLFCESRTNRVGGGIRIHSANLSCLNCSFLNCISSGNGGCISCVNGEKTLTLTNCIFSSNVANGFGGGVYSNRSSLSCVNCSFLHNVGVLKGGAIHCENGGTLTNRTFIGNLKNGSSNVNCLYNNMYSGGAIMQICGSGSLTIKNCTFNQNKNLNGDCKSIIYNLIYFNFFYR